MKKRITALIMSAIMLLTLCSCGKNASVRVNSAKIGKGVYSYFTDLAKRECEKSGETDVTALANKMLIRYVAVNSEFANRGIDLTLEEKSTLSSTVNSYWHLFSKYYEGIGVSKNDLYKIGESKCYETRLMEVYYSENGDSPVTDSELKEFFNNNFVAFRSATGFLTTVDENNNTVSLSEEERQKTAEVFKRMANEINEGVASVDNAASYAENVAVTDSVVVIDKNSTKYPDGFFDNVKGIEVGTTGSFTVGDYIFTVTRSDITSDELFDEYKSDCLKAMKGEEFEKLIEAWTAAYSVN